VRNPFAIVLIVVAVLTAACGAPGSPSVVSPAEQGLVVTVLYFQNNTGDDTYDVVGKGLADMMVTDLARNDEIVVVERQRLQELIVELHLQQSSLFEADTAQKLGKALGASHAVTGSIAAVDPQIRIDVRLIDVATAEVQLAEQVVGNKGDFFALQQELSASGKDEDEETMSTMEEYGEALMVLDRRIEAIAMWQRALDEYPTGPSYDSIEHQLKEALGVE